MKSTETEKTAEQNNQKISQKVREENIMYIIQYCVHTVAGVNEQIHTTMNQYNTFKTRSFFQRLPMMQGNLEYPHTLTRRNDFM